MKKEETLEKKIEKAEYDGWEVVERKEYTVLLERQSFGSMKAHMVLLILTAWWTFGVGNLLYALYKHMNPEKQILEIDSPQQEDLDGEIEQIKDIDELNEIVAKNTDTEIRIKDSEGEITPVERETESKAVELKVMQEMEGRKLRLEEEKLKLEKDKERRRRQAESSKNTREVIRTFRKIF